MLKKFVSIIGWILIFELIGYFLGLITQVNDGIWYQTLNKSTLTPPAIIFPIAWSILYPMIAVSGWLLWEHRAHPKAKIALTFYSAQMILNWSWSPIFFNYHLITISVFCILLITFLTLTTILLTRNHFKISSILLIPYFVWLMFASYLNCAIWALNSF